MSERVYRLGWGPWHHKLPWIWSEPGISISQISAERLGAATGDGRQIVLTLLSHCLWVYKGRTDVSERVYRLGWGPWYHKRVGFGVSQAARSTRFQPNDGVLRREMRLHIMFTLFFHCLWVYKGRTNVS